MDGLMMDRSHRLDDAALLVEDSKGQKINIVSEVFLII